MAALRCGVDGAFGPWEGGRSRFERFADGIKDGVARLYAGLRPVFVRWLVSAHVRSRGCRPWPAIGRRLAARPLR